MISKSQVWFDEEEEGREPYQRNNSLGNREKSTRIYCLGEPRGEQDGWSIVKKKNCMKRGKESCRGLSKALVQAIPNMFDLSSVSSFQQILGRGIEKQI